MARPKKAVPAYLLHRSTGQARIVLTGPDGRRRQINLGTYGSPESKAEYARIIAEFKSGTTSPALSSSTISVNELVEAFKEHAEKYYRRPDGTTTNELKEYGLALRVVRELYGYTPAKEFGPLALKAVRQRFVESGLCRTQVNARTSRIRRAFKWAMSEQLIPPDVFVALSGVDGLRRGRSGVRESDPVRPVKADQVAAVLPFLRPAVRAMVEIQQLTGMRPGEVVRLCPADLDRTAAVWHYRPSQHKNSHRGKSRVVAIGPRAQALLLPFTPFNPDDHFFSPRSTVEQLHAERSEARETPRYPSHMQRNERKRVKAKSRPPADHYSVASYGRAIARACDAAFPLPPALAQREGESNRQWRERLGAKGRDEVKAWRRAHRWHPNQLRHAHGTNVRERYGLEAAQVALGHERADVTQIYAEKNLALADKVAAEMG